MGRFVAPAWPPLPAHLGHEPLPKFTVGSWSDSACAGGRGSVPCGGRVSSRRMQRTVHGSSYHDCACEAEGQCGGESLRCAQWAGHARLAHSHIPSHGRILPQHPALNPPHPPILSPAKRGPDPSVTAAQPLSRLPKFPRLSPLFQLGDCHSNMDKQIKQMKG